MVSIIKKICYQFRCRFAVRFAFSTAFEASSSIYPLFTPNYMAINVIRSVQSMEIRFTLKKNNNVMTAIAKSTEIRRNMSHKIFIRIYRFHSQRCQWTPCKKIAAINLWLGSILFWNKDKFIHVEKFNFTRIQSAFFVNENAFVWGWW